MTASLANAFRGTPTRFCVISFTSDWLFPTAESRAIVHALNAAGARVSFAEITTDKGHDAFLLDEPELFGDRARLSRTAAQARGLPAAADDAVAAQHDLTMAEAARGPGGSRVDLAGRRRHGGAAARACSTSAAATANCCGFWRRRGVDGRGIELSREGVNECVAKGLAVVQGDADTDLADYPDDAFDFVILSQTLQATRQPRVVLEHMLRIGRHAIVSFPNFGHWRIRLQIAVRRPHAAHRQSALCLVRDAQHPFLQHQGFPRTVPTWSAPRWSRRWRSMPGAAACG